MNDALALLDRGPLFDADIARHEPALASMVGGARFLVIGGAGSIGQAVTREIFRRAPRALHVVDISENNLVELVRDIRSTLGYLCEDFRTFAIDCGAREFEALLASQPGYDYVLNLSALKHVRSEKDPFTLMRMVQVNVVNTVSTLRQAEAGGARKYFCVSTDKAANPVNMMGASKRIMELYLARASLDLPVSTARFANVAFSDGSLLHGFNQRILKRQPISAPNDVRRYFITPRESGELCLASCLLGENRDVFFPKLSESLHLARFSDIAVRHLAAQGYEAVPCATEQEARDRAGELIPRRKWPCYFFASDTTGEKDVEAFYVPGEPLDLDRFESIGVVKSPTADVSPRLDWFIAEVERIRARPTWGKAELLEAFNAMLPGFAHLETGRYLDDRM